MRVMGILAWPRPCIIPIMRDHFLPIRPAIVSFSGGRTSGYLLHQVIRAHGGTLPDDVIPVFANTGREHPATYTFVQTIMDRWNVPVHWVEYIPEKPLVRRVMPHEADRDGKVFESLIARRKFLPNPLARFCTSEMKVLAIRRYAKRILGWKDGWTTMIGIRADEPRRVAKIKDHLDEIKVCPLARAGVTVEEVNAFWSAHPFDLGFPPGDNSSGNCYGCFLKTRRTIERLMSEDPRRMQWWVDMEERMGGAKFRKDFPSYGQMMHQVTIQGQLYTGPGEDIACGACTD